MVRPRSFFAVVCALAVIALTVESVAAASSSRALMRRNGRLFAMRLIRSRGIIRSFTKMPVPSLSRSDSRSPSTVSTRPASSSSSSPPSNSSSSSSAASVDSTLRTVRAQILSLVNQERSKAGLPALREERHLDAAAQGHAEDMRTRGYFAHETPEGRTPMDRIRAARYPFQGSGMMGENIAKGQRSPEEAMNAWMASPGHRTNILSGDFTEIGIGYVGFVWVQNFAQP